jgi:PAS domain S-box-containing protein
VFEHIHNCKDGKQMPVEISSRVIEYEGQLAIQSFVRDITVRKQAEEKLALYRDIVTRTQEPLAILDLQGYYIEQNPAHHSLLGYPKEKLFGRTAAFHLGKEKFAQIFQDLKEKGSYSGEVTSRTNSGESLSLQLDAYILRNQAGEPIWYLFLPRLMPTLE